MDKSRRKELQEAYKEIKTYMGAILITNRENGKRFVNTYPNLKNKWLMIQMQLDMGQFQNLALQKEWKEFGREAFDYEVLEEQDAGKIADVKWELKVLEKKWLEKLQPFDDRGYNRRPANWSAEE